MDEELLQSVISHFNVNTCLRDVRFKSCSQEPYDSPKRNNIFGEKKCVLYIVRFAVFNVEVTFRILSFIYDNDVEVLKLEIEILNDLLKREMLSCRNFLQRKRNLNLAFDVIIKLAEMFEARRLICRILFQKLPQATIVSQESGMNVKLFSPDLSMLYLDLSWTFWWNVEDLQICDVIEFYCNDKVLERNNGAHVRDKLHNLVQAGISFHDKLKLWKGLLTDLYGENFNVKNLQISIVDLTNTLELSDSSANHIVDSNSLQNKTITIDDDVLVIE